MKNNVLKNSVWCCDKNFYDVNIKSGGKIRLQLNEKSDEKVTEKQCQKFVNDQTTLSINKDGEMFIHIVSAY